MGNCEVSIFFLFHAHKPVKNWVTKEIAIVPFGLSPVPVGFSLTGTTGTLVLKTLSYLAYRLSQFFTGCPSFFVKRKIREAMLFQASQECPSF